MIEDIELLRRHVDEKSEAAFAELVQRRLNFVYACALRRVGGDSHRAEDVAQLVFCALARNAASLTRRDVLTGWLYTTTRNAALQVQRGEHRRRARESAAHFMHELTTENSRDADWQRLRPVLDAAMDGLSSDDQQAVLLRYFEGKSFADIGAKLRLADNAARMRVERALDRLRAALERRGVTSTAAGLALALAHQPVVAAPAGFAAAVTGAALAGTSAGAGGVLAGLLGIGKLQVAAAVVVAATGTTVYLRQAETNDQLRREIAGLQVPPAQVAALRAEQKQLRAQAAEVELLRQDDVEFKQLAQRVESAKQANLERTRQAQIQAASRRQTLERVIRDEDRLAQVEVDRLNKEGNALVLEYKALSARAKDGAVTGETRAEAEAAAKAKMAQIWAKQREVQDFLKKTREGLNVMVTELRAVSPPVPGGAYAPEERRGLELRATEMAGRRAVPDGNANDPVTPPAREALHFRP